MVLEIGSELFYQAAYTIGIIIGAFIVSRILDRAIGKFAERARFDKHTARPIMKLVNAAVYIAALFFLLGIWGLKTELTGLLAGAGIAGIVIGFATKDIFSDLLAGIMLFFDRPFKIGHTVNIEKLWGIVEDIGIRSTKIKTFDNKFIVIPNSKVAKSIITNVSIYEGRRIELNVGVDYKTDLKKAEKAIRRALVKLQKQGMVLKDSEKRKNLIFLNSFGDSSINFRILFWYDPEYTKKHGIWFGIIKSEFIDAIHREFKKSRIGIPFPQVDVHMKRK